MAFRDVLFPEHISYGSTGGPKFNTTVLVLASGYEKRNINWEIVRGEYEAQHAIKTRAEMEEVMNFFMAMMGRAYSFRYKDWLDFELTDQTIGTGDGVETEFQLVKRYFVTNTPDTYFYDRIITKPVEQSISGVTINLVPQTEVTSGLGAGEFMVDYDTGIFTFGTTPANGHLVVVGHADFDVHARFDTDHLNVSQDFWETMTWPSIPIVEIKEQGI